MDDEYAGIVHPATWILLIQTLEPILSSIMRSFLYHDEWAQAINFESSWL